MSIFACYIIIFFFFLYFCIILPSHLVGEEKKKLLPISEVNFLRYRLFFVFSQSLLAWGGRAGAATPAKTCCDRRVAWCLESGMNRTSSDVFVRFHLIGGKVTVRITTLTTWSLCLCVCVCVCVCATRYYQLSMPHSRVESKQRYENNRYYYHYYYHLLLSSLLLLLLLLFIYAASTVVTGVTRAASLSRWSEIQVQHLL